MSKREQNETREERIQQEMETFKEWLKGPHEWNAPEVIERHALIAGKLHLSYVQLIDILEDVPLAIDDEYRLFIYHLCIFLKSLELHQKGERR